MNKNQLKAKKILQNTRNKMINKRYKSIIKNLIKHFLKNLKNLYIDTKIEKINKIQILNNLIAQIYSIFDKAVKKNIIHKNFANRKKSKLMKLNII